MKDENDNEMIYLEIRIDRDAWIAGFRAGAAGRRTCPYPPATCEAYSWSSGFVEGEAKRQGCEYSLGTLPPEEVEG